MLKFKRCFSGIPLFQIEILHHSGYLPIIDGVPLENIFFRSSLNAV